MDSLCSSRSLPLRGRPASTRQVDGDETEQRPKRKAQSVPPVADRLELSAARTSGDSKFKKTLQSFLSVFKKKQNMDDNRLLCNASEVQHGTNILQINVVADDEDAASEKSFKLSGSLLDLAEQTGLARYDSDGDDAAFTLDASLLDLAEQTELVGYDSDEDAVIEDGYAQRGALRASKAEASPKASASKLRRTQILPPTLDNTPLRLASRILPNPLLPTRLKTIAEEA